MSKRGARVERPPKKDEWDLRFGKKEAAANWKQACNRWSGACTAAWDQLTKDPRHRSDRQHQLKGAEAYVERGGQRYEHWQYELTGVARIHYTIDDDKRTVYFEAVWLGHPKKTEKIRGKRRRG